MPFGNRKRKALDEEKYLADLEHIITRDFFPHSEAVSLRLKYYDAVENNDFKLTKEIQMKLNRIEETFRSSASGKLSSVDKDSMNMDFPYKNPNVKEERDLPLDAYLARNTSEDNDYFRQLQQKAVEKQLKKFQYSIKASEDYQEYLRIQNKKDDNVLAIEYDKDKTEKNKGFDDARVFNPLFFNPDSVQLSSEERIKLANKKSVVNYDLFKFAKPFLYGTSNKKQKFQSQANTKSKIPGKFGVDGKEVNLEGTTPTIGGYSVLLDSNTPDFDFNKTPGMTWGEIDGTPREIMDMGPSSKFFIPELTHTEINANALVAEMSKKKRQQTAQTRRLTSQHALSTRLTGSRRAMLTPHGQQLLSRMTPGSTSSISSLALRDHYRNRSLIKDSPAIKSSNISRSHTPHSSSNNQQKPSRSSNITDDLL